MYKGAVYIRCSKYNNEKENSIYMQQCIVHKFVESKPDIVVEDVFVDNGYSGLDFLRPGFGAMMEEIERGNIDCVLVKDLSRLGRDYIETGRYLQYVFPRKHVRFISVCDGYDSIEATDIMNYFMIPMRNYINDLYSKDISIKVRSALETRRKNGICTLNRVSFGYKKVCSMNICNIQGMSLYDYGREYDRLSNKKEEHINDYDKKEYYKLCKGRKEKNIIIIDEEAAKVVRDIFRYSLEGYSMNGIANMLNKKGVCTPMEYRREKGIFKKNIQREGMHVNTMQVNTIHVNTIQVKGEHTQDIQRQDPYGLWSTMMVKRILTDEMYIGTLVQGKVKKISYKSKEREYIDGKYWHRKYNNHEKIIDEETFAIVNRLLKYDIRASSREGKCHNLGGLIFCGKCGKIMICRKNKYVCGTYNKGRGCENINIKREDINTIIRGVVGKNMRREELVYIIKWIRIEKGNKVRIKLWK